MCETGLAQGSMERGLFADLGHAAARPVDVGRGGGNAVGAKPVEQIRAGIEVTAVAEDFLQAGGGELDERAQQLICGAVTIGDEGEAQRLVGWQLLGDLLTVG